MRIFEGEIREIGVEVFNRNSNDFVIEVAEYKIKNKAGDILKQGFPVIAGHRLTVLFNGEEKGVYHIEFKYHIGPEILKAKIMLEVV